MLRSILQIYVKERKEAAELYKEAFDAKMGFQDVADDGTIIHMELDICGQAFAIGEVRNSSCAGDKISTGNTCSFAFNSARGRRTGLKRHMKC